MAIQFAAGLSILGELMGIVPKLIESPETYDRLEGLRTFLCKLTGKDIPKAGLIALLEETTQGAAYTGKWEDLPGGARRMRWSDNPGWVVQVAEGTNPIFVPDK